MSSLLPKADAPLRAIAFTAHILLNSLKDIGIAVPSSIPPYLWLCCQCAACVPIARSVMHEGEGRPIGSTPSDLPRNAKRVGSVAVRRQRSVVAERQRVMRITLYGSALSAFGGKADVRNSSRQVRC
jgi:hypothetical protein